jgi:hypothetical protein
MEKDLSTARIVIENAGPREGFNIDKERGFSNICSLSPLFFVFFVQSKV